MPAGDDARGDRWEHGSDFSYPSSLPPSSSDAERWLPPSASYWHSGRDALRALIRSIKPRRVLFPSFYCQDVYGAAADAGVEHVVAYADGPTDASIDPSFLRAGDLIVVTNTYGLRPRSPLPSASVDVTVVEDHTHDPTSHWARTSTADYAFASLRKWFPLPDGGVLWSPRKGEAPSAPELLGDPSAKVTLDRLTGMLLKARFLAGEGVDKAAFRALLVRGEGQIGRSRDPQPISPIARALLDLLPTQAWRATRRANHEAFVAAAARDRAPGRDSAPFRVLSKMAAGDVDITPYCVVLELDSHEEREALRSRLVAQRVYPAVLWPMDGGLIPGIPGAHVDLSKRLLCLHCDHRYTKADMTRVAHAL